MPKGASARTASVRKQNKSPLRAILQRTNLVFGAVLLMVIVIIIGAVLALDDTKPKSADKPKLQADASCGPYRDDVNVKISGRVFKTELTKTTTEQAKGLGGRPCIGPNQAMLFAFNKQGQYRFW